MSPRTYHRFRFKDANFRICTDRAEAVTGEIVRQRGILDAYIETHPDFATSLEPLAVEAGAPDVARRMAAAAEVVGVGPMRSVPMG